MRVPGSRIQASRLFSQAIASSTRDCSKCTKPTQVYHHPIPDTVGSSRMACSKSAIASLSEPPVRDLQALGWTRVPRIVAICRERDFEFGYCLLAPPRDAQQKAFDPVRVGRRLERLLEPAR